MPSPMNDGKRITLVRDLMTDVVETLRVGDTLAQAERQMKAGRIRHLPVVDEHEHLIGLVTHRQLIAAWLSHGHPEKETHRQLASEVPVEMLMERDVLTVPPGLTAALAAALLEKSKFGALPVVDGGKLIGILTEADFLTFARRYFEAEAQ